MALTPKNTDKNSGQDNPKTPGLTAEDEIALREIDEAVRKDDAAEFARKYGLPIGSVIAIALAGLAGYLWWDSSIEAGLEKQSEEIIGIRDYADASDFPSVKERTQPLLDAETVGVRSSARFMQAAAALETGETARAMELYAKIAADEEAPQALRDFALLREVTTNFDDREPADIIASLESLVVPESPLYGSAAELTAIAYMEAGDNTAAGELFAAIAKNEDLPGSLRDRARQMAGQLGIDAIEDVDALLEDQGISPQGDGALAPAP